jgi:L-aspartate oxidase
VLTKTDFLVIGSGVAGLSFALAAAEHGEVLIVTKRDRAESNTRYAQGGIAAVLAEGDTPEAHKADTLIAGAGLCHEVAVDVCVREGPDRVRALMAGGARFDRDDNDGHRPRTGRRPLRAARRARRGRHGRGGRARAAGAGGGSPEHPLRSSTTWRSI